MISTSDFRTGLTIEVDGAIMQILEFQHVKPGKGAAFVRCKLRNIISGSVVEKTFRPTEKFPPARLDRREMQYLYKDDENYAVMDNETFEQISLTEGQLGDTKNFLIENMNLSVLIYQGKVIGVEPPKQVTLRIVETEPGIKGDTASGGTKSATVETGYVVQVPFFIEQDELIIVDTRTGDYVSRA